MTKSVVAHRRRLAAKGGNMTEQLQVPPTRARKGWKFLLLLVSLIFILEGILGMRFVSRDSERIMGLIGIFDVSAGTFVVGVIGLFRFSFWTAIGQRPVVRGGLIAAALLSYAMFLPRKAGVFWLVLLILMLPLGGFVAANSHFRQSLNNISLGLGAKIGMRSGLVAAIVVFVLTTPLSLFREYISKNALYSSVYWMPDDERAQLQAKFAFSFSGWLGDQILAFLVLSILMVGLTSLGGLVRGMTYRHSKKSA